MAHAVAAQELSPSPETVAQYFVNQYYEILRTQPDQAHRFYKDESIMSRPLPNAEMSLVTTTQDINEQIMSTDFKDWMINAKIVKAQESVMGSVIVAVAGTFTQKDGKMGNFVQTFFLAPQTPGGFYVHNDIMHLVKTHDQVTTPLAVSEVMDDFYAAPLPQESAEPTEVVESKESETPEPIVKEATPVKEVTPELAPKETTPELAPKEVTPELAPKEASESFKEIDAAPTDSEPTLKEASKPQKEVEAPANLNINPKDANDNKEAIIQMNLDPTPNEAWKITKKGHRTSSKKEQVLPNVDEKSVLPASNQVTLPEEETKKTSYATILAEASSSSKPPLKVIIPKAAPRAQPKSSTDGTEKNLPVNQEGPKGIHIKSLPADVTHAILLNEVKKFGPVRPKAIQIRQYPEDGYRFAFVEFETANAARSAVEAREIVLCGKKVEVQYKRSQGGNNQGRSGGGRGNWRNGGASRRNGGGSSRNGEGSADSAGGVGTGSNAAENVDQAHGGSPSGNKRNRDPNVRGSTVMIK